MGLSKNDPLFISKKTYLDKSGRGVASVRFPLQRSRYPSELVDFLRLLLVEPEDLGMQVLYCDAVNSPYSHPLTYVFMYVCVYVCAARVTAA